MEKYSEDVRQHLSFIQGVITRMNSNSFNMKGWMVTIVAALAALYANGNAPYPVVYLIISLIPVLIFWCLDTYYLMMEKKYRKLYEDTVAGNVTLYSMKIDKYKVCYGRVLISKTIWPVYLPVFLLLLIFIFFIA